jgi:hypothetical protein
VARVVNTTFFFATSVYCLLSYNAFTYEQFIKPGVSAALAAFAVWHGDLHWLVLSITALTLAPFLKRSRAQWIGWSYLAASVALSIWLFTHPLWLQPGTSRANLILAVIATLPPIWLAVFDHVVTEIRSGALAPAAFSEPTGGIVLSNGARAWRSCWITALYAFGVYAAAALVRVRLAGGVALPFDSLVLGWMVSGLAHVTAFTLVFLVLIVVSGLAAQTRSSGGAEYWLLYAISVGAIALTLVHVMLAPIAIRGPAAWIASLAVAAALASAWSGIVRHRLAAQEQSRPFSAREGLDAWLAPIGGKSPAVNMIGLVIVTIAVQFLIGRMATFDWEFMLQKLTTIGLWVLAFGFIHRITRLDRPGLQGPGPGRALWMGPAAILALFAVEQVLLPRLPAVVRDARLNPEFALDGYVSVDPSFRIARDMLGSGTTGDAAEFYSYLRGNAGLERTYIGPVDIAFAQRWTHSTDRPHIFLFIIDSLRRDYVSSYNDAVTFTPAIRAFGDDSLVFRRAFSRYGGTGLSVPAIWAGSMIIHKQYVTPFAPMNALEKLVVAKGYRRIIAEDHISEELFTPSADTIGLDHNIGEMFHTFCRTAEEIEQDLQRLDPARPLFVLTRPLDLHIGNVASAKTPRGESYPGFYGPYAARVRRIDACFGKFIETLKDLHLYDNSIIVLTSDHGDSLGEGQRWGHGYTAFPEVLRVPLIIHVPAALQHRMSADLGRLSFSTDITPTLYSLLGEPPPTSGPRGTRDLLMGSPLLTDPSADLSWRRRESYLVASSYGAVFGLLGRNGRRLYVADAVESREYAYELGVDGHDVRVGITDAEREASRRAIRKQIAELAAWYGLTPEP